MIGRREITECFGSLVFYQVERWRLSVDRAERVRGLP